MLHVGEPGFFQTVYSDAFSHDVVLVEGVRSPVVRRIARSYRWIEGSERMNLVAQPPYPTQASCHARIVHADLSAEEFARAWLGVPLWLRALIYVVVPLIGARRRWFESRETLAKALSLDDLPSRQEILDLSPETIALDRAILHARDARLVEQLREQLDDPHPDAWRLAIVYGANHMRAVLHELTHQRGYHVEHGDWLTVFSI
jgi:hypothetical protein